MRKALVIIAVIALLGLAAAYANPLGGDDGAKTTLSAGSGSTASSTATGTAASSQSAGTSTTGTSTTQSATTQTASNLKDGTYHGSTASSPYGDVRVAITIQGGKITAVNLDTLTVSDGHSQRIDDIAIPELKSQTLAAQSANIDGVSGASYTTSAYEESLQSALDKAKA